MLKKVLGLPEPGDQTHCPDHLVAVVDAAAAAVAVVVQAVLALFAVVASVSLLSFGLFQHVRASDRFKRHTDQ